MHRSNIELKIKSYVVDIMPSLPKHVFYKTSISKNINTDNDNDNSFFVFITDRISNPDFELLEVRTLYFKIWVIVTLGITKPCGYIIIPKVLPGFKLRYTPYSLCIVSPESTLESTKTSNKHLLYSDQNSFEIFKLDNNSELLTTLGLLLGVKI